MMRLPRLIFSSALACCLAATLSWNISGTKLYAADEPAMPPATPVVPPATPPTGGADATPPAAGTDATPPAGAAATPDSGTATTTPSDTTATTEPAKPTLDVSTPANPADVLNLLPSANGAAGAAAEKPALLDQVETFWHYGQVARYDLASATGDKIVAAKPDPTELLLDFETIAGKNHDSIDGWMVKWQVLPVPSDDQIADSPDLKSEKTSYEKMKTVTGKLRDLINEGYATRSSSPDYIHDTIVEMSTGARAYDNNLPRIQRSGELAVKVLVDMLRNPADRQYGQTARKVLRDLGKKAVNPLVAATEMKDNDTLPDVCSALGDLGYDAAIPYLARLATLPEAPAAVHTAAQNALTKMGAGNAASLNAPNLFYELAEKIYYNIASISPSAEKTSYIWYWKEGTGLYKLDVASAIFNDIMAMREAEYTMKLDPAKGAAVSLWLAANTKREADLPKGAGDPTHKGDPDAHYYNVSSGVQYLNEALARAIHDRNAAVTLKLTQALQSIIGQRELTGALADPLIQAIYFPNRLVQYEAAFALAETLPAKNFPGSDRVVPLLVEAMGQSAKLNVLVVAPEADLGNLRDAATSSGYQVAAAKDAVSAANQSMTLSSVDVIVISEDSDVQRMIELEQTTAHLQGAALLVMTHGPGSSFAVRSQTDSLMNSAVMPPKGALAATLKTEIERARLHAGTSTLSDQQASAYALRAADLLVKLAITRGQALDLTVAEGGVLTGLNDSRPDIAKAAGRVLAVLDSQPAQNGLAARASDESAPADVRVSLYKSLAASAKSFGNKLGDDQISALEKVVTDSKNADIRGAAAEARGALNLPSDQARSLILGQSRN